MENMATQKNFEDVFFQVTKMLEQFCVLNKFVGVTERNIYSLVYRSSALFVLVFFRKLDVGESSSESINIVEARGNGGK